MYFGLERFLVHKKSRRVDHVKSTKSFIKYYTSATDNNSKTSTSTVVVLSSMRLRSAETQRPDESETLKH